MPAGFTLPTLKLDNDATAPMAIPLRRQMSPNDFVTPTSSPQATSALLSNLSFAPLGSPLALGRRRLDAFHIMCLIGKGGFGKVFMVRHKATTKVYAMKVMEKETLIQRKAVNDAHTERNILALVGRTDAPFIIRLHIAFQTARRVYLVMDFASGGELMFHLRREAMLDEKDARFYAAELLLALESLHTMGIVHRDIKPENVLLDGEGHLVLTDFGLAKEIAGLEDQTHSWCGSEDYMAPEIIARAQHAGKPADYWAYGVFIFDCLCGHPPFSFPHERGKTSRKRLHDRILKMKPKLPPYLSPECHSLLRKLLTRDVKKRLTNPEEIRRHPWFAAIDWERLRKKQHPPPFIPSQSSPTACFSPSLTKTACSAPHSPLDLGMHANNMPPPSAPIGVAVGSTAPPENIWNGFSFVAPGMEVHFELAPPALGRAHPAQQTVQQQQPTRPPPSVLTASPEIGAAFVPAATPNMSIAIDTREPSAEWEDPLVAELAEFSVEAKEAVEIIEN